MYGTHASVPGVFAGPSVVVVEMVVPSGCVITVVVVDICGLCVRGRGLVCGKRVLAEARRAARTSLAAGQLMGAAGVLSGQPLGARSVVFADCM